MIEYKENALKWCKVPFDIKTQREVKSLFDQPDQLEDAFHKNLKFGTGGMRGIIYLTMIMWVLLLKAYEDFLLVTLYRFLQK